MIGTKGVAFPAIGSPFACEVVREARDNCLIVTGRGPGRTLRIQRSRFKPDAATLPVHRHVLTSQPDYELGAGVPQPKPVAWRSAGYAAFVRTHPCVSCRATADIEAAHFGPDSGMGRKASDVFLNPLCRACHRHWHLKGTLSALTRMQSEALLIERQRDLLAEWIMRGEEE